MEMTDIERFWSHVDMRDPSECWPWVGRSRNAEGYGRFSFGGSGRWQPAPRWLLGHLRGEPLRWDGVKELACHTCDNPPCCNPNHLYVGSPLTNVNDMYARGRAGGKAAGRVETYCKHGHPFDEVNTYRHPRGFQVCRTCLRAAKARYRQRKKAG